MDKNKYYKKIGIKIAVLLVVLLGLFLLYKLTIFYIPFLIAIIISSIINPMINFFAKKCKMKRKVACTISLLLVIGVIGILLTLGITKLVEECTNLISNSNEYFGDLYRYCLELINDIQNGNLPMSENMAKLVKQATEGILDGGRQIAVNTGKTILSTIGSIPTMITYIVITILATIFTCYDRQYVLDKIKSQVPSKWVEKVKEIYNEMCSVSLKYIKAEIKLSSICFLLVLVGLIIFNLFGLDVKYTILMAVLIGFVDLLPLFGAGAVMIPWACYLAIIGNMPLAIAVVCLWGVWAILKQFIEPRMVSKQIGMHPIFTLLGMYTGFRILGVLGLMVGPIVFLIIGNVFRELLKKGVLKSFFEME